MKISEEVPSGRVGPNVFIGGGGVGRVKGLKEFVVKSVVKGLLFFFLVARHWDAHTPTFTLDNFPQMFGLTLLDSLNCYTRDKHGQRGRASHGTNVQSFWTKYTGYRYDTTELSNEPLLYVEKVQIHLRCWILQKVLNQAKLLGHWHEKNIALSLQRGWRWNANPKTRKTINTKYTFLNCTKYTYVCLLASLLNVLSTTQLLFQHKRVQCQTRDRFFIA